MNGLNNGVYPAQAAIPFLLLPIIGCIAGFGFMLIGALSVYFAFLFRNSGLLLFGIVLFLAGIPLLTLSWLFVVKHSFDPYFTDGHLSRSSPQFLIRESHE